MKLNNTIEINEIITFYYFDFSKNYSYDGEKHDFWEIVYVDKGKLEVRADNCYYTLYANNMIFHQPNEFHSLKADGKTAPNVIVMSFVCTSKAMDFFKKKIFKLNKQQISLLSNIAKEIKLNFEAGYIKKKHSFNIGCEQILKIKTEEFLINCLRYNDINNLKPYKLNMTINRENNRIDNIEQILMDYLYDNISLDQVSKLSNLSKPYLQDLFKRTKKTSVMRYYRSLRMDEAKRMIREKNLTFTEISQILNFGSIHHFSKQFKDIVNMTPTEYAKSTLLY
ncbi:AraC family transcriptional regulator [Clostridiaceae bacterium M8S5]|nr:AraC family transcriptional regulator [Clostridiaceae bacterium M8S5]